MADILLEAPWDHKTVFLLYTNLIINLLKALLYVIFFIIMMQILTLPIFALRPMFYAVKDLNKAFKGIVLSRRAIRNMNTLYPDATPEDLRAFDNVCIICREEFNNGSTSKKLPCSHIFHTSCLRSWFQRQQTCPTCRLNVLQFPTPSQQNMQQQQRPQDQQHLNNSSERTQNSGNVGQNADVNPRHNIHPGPSSSAAINSNQSEIPPALYPIYFTPPLPTIPSFCEGLCDEEIKSRLAAEGVEAKIRYLQNAKAFMNAAIAMLQHCQAAHLVHQGTQTSEETPKNEEEVLNSHQDSALDTLHVPRFQNDVPTTEGFPENYEFNNSDFLIQVRHRRLELLNKKEESSDKTQ